MEVPTKTSLTPLSKATAPSLSSILKVSAMLTSLVSGSFVFGSILTCSTPSTTSIFSTLNLASIKFCIPSRLFWLKSFGLASWALVSLTPIISLVNSGAKSGVDLKLLCLVGSRFFNIVSRQPPFWLKALLFIGNSNTTLVSPYWDISFSVVV